MGFAEKEQLNGLWIAETASCIQVRHFLSCAPQIMEISANSTRQTQTGMESCQGHGPGLHRVTAHQTKSNRLSLPQRSCSIRQKSSSKDDTAKHKSRRKLFNSDSVLTCWIMLQVSCGNPSLPEGFCSTNAADS